MTLRKELSDIDVRNIINKSIELIDKTQSKSLFQIIPNIKETKIRLLYGKFKAEKINKRRKKDFSMEYGSFIPPSTIILDKRLPFSDKPLNLPELADTMTTYSAVHEIIHADDYFGSNILLVETRNHILKKHQDKLDKSLEIIKKECKTKAISDYEDLANLWAMQYVDMVTHYRSYFVLRYNNYPQLGQVWSRLNNDYFPPNLLTCIERSKGTDYIFKLFREQIGEYCLIEALDEFKEIKEKASRTYTV